MRRVRAAHTHEQNDRANHESKRHDDPSHPTRHPGAGAPDEDGIRLPLCDACVRGDQPNRRIIWNGAVGKPDPWAYARDETLITYINEKSQ
jgi:hypothetical protein